jgi:hypothetical protein
MLRAIADTHAVVWCLFNDSRLSPTARAFIETGAAQNNQIGFHLSRWQKLFILLKKSAPRDATYHKAFQSIGFKINRRL